jgi:hypothetical protein
LGWPANLVLIIFFLTSMTVRLGAGTEPSASCTTSLVAAKLEKNLCQSYKNQRKLLLST